MGVRSSFADNLVQSHPAKPPHDPGTDDKRQEQRRNRRAGSAERNPLKQSQKSEVRQSYEWDE